MVAPAYQLTNFAGTTDPAGGILTLIENQMTIAGWVFVEEYAFTQAATARVMRVWKNPSTLNFGAVDYYVGFVKDAVSGIRLAMRVFENWDAVNKVIERPCIQGSATQAIAGSWSSIAYGNGTFVVLSGGSSTAATCATSVNNGVTWTMRAMPLAQNWNSVTYGNGVFVAVSSTVSAVAATSPDGITWTTRTMPASQSWYSVTYGNSVFVAVGGNATTSATSPDGITWTARTILSAIYLSVIYANSLFVAVGSGTPAATSPDGITWTSRTLPTSVNWSSVAYGNGVFVSVGTSGACATSPTGTTWTSRVLPGSSFTSWSSVAYGNGIFVAIANAPSSPETQNVVTSSDGITWNLQTMPVSAPWTSIIYANSVFVAVANNGNIATSSNGITWTLQSPPKTAYSAGLGSWLPTGVTTPLMVDTPTSTTLISMTNYDVGVLVSKSYIVVGCCLNGSTNWVFQWVLGMFSPSYSDSKIDYPPLMALDPITTPNGSSSGVSRSMRSLSSANTFSVGVGPDAILLGYFNYHEASTYTMRASRAALGSSNIAGGFTANGFRGWLLDAIFVGAGSAPKVGDTVTVGVKTYTILGYITFSQLNFITTGTTCAIAYDVTAGT